MFNLVEVLKPYELNFDDRLFILSLISEQSKSRKIINQQFTESEWRVIKILIATFPSAANYDQIYAAYHDVSQEDAQRILLKAKQGEKYDDEIRPIRRCIQSVKKKLQLFRWNIDVIRNRGYLLSLPA
jgi:hypothetical protein